MEYTYHIVAFDEYCATCKYKDLPESEDPCYDCLAHPANENSRKPVHHTQRKLKKHLLL